MGGLKTLLAALVLAAPLAGPARAGDDLLRTFAQCAGRLSAEMEHSWLMGDGADLAEARRNAMVDLLEALIPPDRGRDVLAWRIDAKFAHAALLARATFNDDADDARWARQQAETYAGACNGLVLG